MLVGAGGAGEMIRMMVPIARRQHLDRHPEEACRLPHIRAGLHEPRSCCVAQGVRDDIVAKSSILHGAGKSFADALYRLPIPLDGKPLSLAFPAA